MTVISVGPVTIDRVLRTTASEKFRALFPTGSACFAVLTFTFLNIQTRLSETKLRMDTELAGNLFRGVADLAVNFVQIQWGFAVLILGACFVMVAAALDDSQRKANSAPGGQVPSFL
jgi:hypothetical protein